MVMRIILLALITFTLAACRGNAPRLDPATRSPGPATRIPDAETHRPPVAERSADRNNDGSRATTQQPTGGAYLAGDGPGKNIPSNLENIPDAVPRAEPLHRYANRKYTVLGKNYTPLTTIGSYKERGVATWYGKKCHGQRGNPLRQWLS